LGHCVIEPRSSSQDSHFYFSPKLITDRPQPKSPLENLLHYSHICGNIYSEVAKMKFVGVREFKEDVVKYLNEGNEIVVMKRKRPIARLTPVPQNSSEIILLEIGRVLTEAGVSEKEALKALEQARKKIYG